MGAGVIAERVVTVGDVRAGVRELGLAGAVVCVHASLRSFGTVTGGAEAVLAGLLAEGCTVMAPTFVDVFEVAPPDELLVERDGWEPEYLRQAELTDRVYDPGVMDIAREMGAVPAALVRWPGRVRGAHPLDSFTAIGPLANELIAGQQPLDVYAPLRALSERGGAVLQMGVGLTSMTLLHLAEHEAGRTLFRRWARGGEGRIVECEIGSCSNGFDAFEPVLEPLARETMVGTSRWRAFPAAEVVAAAAEAIRADPAMTRCADPTCPRCDDAIAGGPLVER